MLYPRSTGPATALPTFMQVIAGRIFGGPNAMPGVAKTMLVGFNAAEAASGLPPFRMGAFVGQPPNVGWGLFPEHPG